MRYFIGEESHVRRAFAANSKFLREHPEYEETLKAYQMVETTWLRYQLFCIFGIKLGAKQ